MNRNNTAEEPSGRTICQECGERWKTEDGPPTRGSYDRRCDEGRKQGEAVAALFEIELTGFGFIREDATFVQHLPNGKEREIKFTGPSMTMILEWAKKRNLS
jgi:hypothetical protein